MKNNKIVDIIDILSQIETDETIPKNMRVKVKDMITRLESSDENVIVDKAIHELDVIAEDPGLPVYAKTQIWNAVSILESGQ